MLGLYLQGLIGVLLCKDVLDGFQVHITQLVLPEVLEVLSSLPELVFVDTLVHVLYSVVKLAENPLVYECVDRTCGVIVHLFG